MKKTMKLGAVVASLAMMLSTTLVFAADGEPLSTDSGAGSSVDVVQTTEVNLGVENYISLACTDEVTMDNITGYGFSDITLGSNDATCTVVTNNTAGYNLTWQASSGYQAAGSMINGNGDLIPAISTTEANWVSGDMVADGASGWGARVSSASERFGSNTGAISWGTGAEANGYSATFSGISTTADEVYQQDTETDINGDDIIILFGAEVDDTKIQATGTYTQYVTFTATTL